MKIQNYERIGILTLDEVFPYIEKHLGDFGKSRVKIKEFSVNVQSLRLRTFYHTGIDCPCCDHSATYFAVERTPGNPKTGYHLNLYGLDKDNNEVLFTHDHTLARALGGADNLSNTRTMCGECNWEKGKLEQILTKGYSDEETQIVREQLERYNQGRVEKPKSKIKI